MVAHRLGRFPEYIFARLARKVAEVEKTSGRKVLGFGAGSPDIRPSEQYVERYAQAIRDPKAHLYPGYAASPAFSRAVVDWYKMRFGADVDPASVVPLLGAKDGTSHLPLALLDDGDAMLVPNPGYPGFVGPLLMYGMEPQYYPLTTDFKIDVSLIEPLVTSKTKAMIVNFPSNPTGQIISKEELVPVVDFARKHNIVLIYDNAYAEIAFDGYKAPSILEIPGAADVAVEFGSFSKTYSFAGYRMGWLVGNVAVAKALLQVKSQIDSGMSLPLQELGIEALSHTDHVWHDHMIAEYTRRRNVIGEKLKTLGLVFEQPRAGLYIWAKIPDSAVSAEAFCMDLLEKQQILLTPGSAFGSAGDRYIRASICVNIDSIDAYFK